MSGSRVVFTRKGVMRGVRIALPMIPAVLPFGLIIGVISDAQGLSFLETVLMSAAVFAGTSQLVALQVWADPAPVFAATLACFIINLRLAPMGAALAPWLDKLRGWKLWGTLATLVDNSFAIAIADQRAGGRDAGLLLGVGLTFWGFWVFFCAAGYAFAGMIALPPGHPIFFASLATLIALMVPLWRGRLEILPWGVAAVAALAVSQGLGLGQPWPVLAGAILGGAAGAWRDMRRPS
ncbi:azaleucine resistance protein AzlC [Roseococcus sp. SYP-B2431]|uniref:AzlC family ABC transporter permease n=1 Tax=Roseococcus sp. SYP-B2431 TaxID=2496640 RepID=UPI0010403323|nr:AzlC family ABC transporter permease [Roseococcus sp. SYP-B2431]TCH96659.1 azaleucine resistance protein AzlC [Roseococcus sp. SYP-B2431]